MNPMLNWGRLAMDGIPVCDIQAAERIEPEAWFDYWAGVGERYAALGSAALESGHRRTAGQLIWLGSLAYQYAQYLWVHEPDRRQAGQRRKVELYAAAAPHLDPPATRIDVPIDDTSIPGYLRLPGAAPSAPRVPCAVLLGGLESTKEESYAFENELLARGIATFAFDGPGQGELWSTVKLVPDFQRYTSAVVDDLVERPELDAERIVVVGRSLGGHYAFKSAAADARFAACVSWGGFYDMSDFDARWPLARQAYATVTGADDVDAARAIVQRSLECDSVIDGLRCPTYHLHGALDAIGLAQVDRLRERAKNAPLTIVVEPDGDHCCHNLGPRIRLAMIDWICDRVAAPAAATS
jgi:2,6-dihydroxypseudooxynicotine hydrolase